MGFSVLTPNVPESSPPRPPKGSTPFATLPPRPPRLPKNQGFPEYIQQTDTGLFIFRMRVPTDCRAAVGCGELQYSLRTRCIYAARQHISPLLSLLNSIFGDIRRGSQPEITGIKEAIRNQILWIHQLSPTVALADNQLTLPEVRADNQLPPAPPAARVDNQLAAQLVWKSHTTFSQPPAANGDHQPQPVRNLRTPFSQPQPVRNLRTTFSQLQEAFFKEKELSDGWREKTREDHAAVFSLFVEVFGDIPASSIDRVCMRDFKTTIMQLPPNMRKVAKFKNKTVAQVVAMKPTVTLSAHTVNKYLSRLSNLFSYAVTHGYMTINPASGLKVKLKSRPDEEREVYTTEDLKKLFPAAELLPGDVGNADAIVSDASFTGDEWKGATSVVPPGGTQRMPIALEIPVTSDTQKGLYPIQTPGGTQQPSVAQVTPVVTPAKAGAFPGYCKWTPLIALYTGCRLEEICQLHLEDIRQEPGTDPAASVWVFDINDKHEKQLKTLSSTRLVPIHPRLIEHGLLEYVAELSAKGEHRLFPELHQRRDGYGQTVSRWFARHKKECGIVTGGKESRVGGKNFHSFRHTFITHLKHKGVDPFMIQEIDGHTIDSETMGRYGKRFPAEILYKEAILKIDYGL